MDTTSACIVVVVVAVQQGNQVVGKEWCFGFGWGGVGVGGEGRHHASCVDCNSTLQWTVYWVTGLTGPPALQHVAAVHSIALGKSSQMQVMDAYVLWLQYPFQSLPHGESFSWLADNPTTHCP